MLRSIVLHFGISEDKSLSSNGFQSGLCGKHMECQCEESASTQLQQFIEVVKKEKRRGLTIGRVPESWLVDT
jgi:hypothetical protein